MWLHLADLKREWKISYERCWQWELFIAIHLQELSMAPVHAYQTHEHSPFICSTWSNDGMLIFWEKFPFCSDEFPSLFNRARILSKGVQRSPGLFQVKYSTHLAHLSLITFIVKYINVIFSINKLYGKCQRNHLYEIKCLEMMSSRVPPNSPQ